MSVASVVADPLPAGLTASPLAQRPADAEQWDPRARAFVPRPPKVVRDRVADVKADPAFADLQAVYNGANAANRGRIDAALARLLGSQRHRAEGEPLAL